MKNTKNGYGKTMNSNMIHILMIMILTPHHLIALGGLDEFGGIGLCI
jgi:hypothetical protein